MYRASLRHKDVIAVYFRDSIAWLMILHHGPRDIDEINRLLMELETLKKKATYFEDHALYVVQIDAYKILKRHLEDEQRKGTSA
jgi:hypothetical protein